MLQICKWRMTVRNVQMHRQVGKNRWENEMSHGMRRRMESDLWNLQRRAARTLKIHLKQSRCIIHAIMTYTHTLTHSVDRMTLSSVRTCTHYAYAVSAKKRTWRQGQCAAAEEEVQNLQSVEADALHVSLRNNPIKGSPEKEKRKGERRGKGSWIELNWVSLCRSTWLTFMSSELCDKLEQHPIKMRVLLKKLKYTHWHTHTRRHT